MELNFQNQKISQILKFIGSDDCPIKSNCIYCDDASLFHHEQEVLLKDNSKFELYKIESANALKTDFKVLVFRPFCGDSKGKKVDILS